MAKPVPWPIDKVFAGVPTPWAVLRCRFKDGPQDAPIPLEVFERLFTTKGEGTWNTVRFFHEMSHGNVDLSGSQVFGWLTLDITLEDYGPELNDVDRTYTQADVVRLARKAALQAGIKLDDFFGDCITFNVAVGGAQGGGVDGRPYAWADYRWVAGNGTTAWGHEMGHGYGLGHSRRDGSDADYMDPWDIMSTGFQTADADFGLRGPGLNAANMRVLAWLNEDRVWRGGPQPFDQVLHLRPLHRRDLPGMLAAELPAYGPASPHVYLVEFRIRDGWDAGIPRSAVFVHEIFDGRSYLMASFQGQQDLVKGDVFERGAASVPWSPLSRVEVIDIDETNQTATVRLQARRAAEFPHYEISGKVIGQVAADGGGVIITGGGIVPVGPWDPMAKVLQHVASWSAAGSIVDPQLRRAARLDTLKQLRGRIDETAHDLESCRPMEPRALSHVEAGQALTDRRQTTK